jgi:hypothetical protein
MILSKLLRAFLVSWLVVSTAFAQELKLAYPFEPVAMMVDNKPGLFFPAKDAEYILYLRTDVINSLVEKGEAQKLQLNLQTTQIKDLEAKLVVVDNKFQVELKAQESCSLDLQKCLNKPNAWYMSPAFLIGVGVVGGVLLTVAVAAAVK